ncbi:MAG: DUF3276 family protein [Patescibacteria group bacterium]|nr:DUF3276 family protein [Patescibacteria group bacterium]
MNEAIFSKSLKAGGNTYFFDVKQAQGGKQSKYMQISESWMNKDGQRHRGSITVFSDQLQAFGEALAEAGANTK